MQKNVLDTIQKVEKSFPSLFSREDVIKLLTDLDAELAAEEPKLLIAKDALVDVFRQVFSQKDFSNIVDKDSAEMSMSYNTKGVNTVELDSVDIDEDDLVSSAVDALEASWDALEEAANED